MRLNFRWNSNLVSCNLCAELIDGDVTFIATWGLKSVFLGLQCWSSDTKFGVNRLVSCVACGFSLNKFTIGVVADDFLGLLVSLVVEAEDRWYGLLNSGFSPQSCVKSTLKGTVILACVLQQFNLVGAIVVNQPSFP